MLRSGKTIMQSGILVMLILIGAFAVTVVKSQDQPAATDQPAETDQPNAVEAPTQVVFSYQGRLLDKSGNAINNPSVPMLFELYRQQSGGSNCWREDHTGSNGVKVENGAFQVLLGQRTAIAASCVNGDVYLQLTINGELLSPRERLTSVATAVEASSLAGGAAVNGDLMIQGAAKAAPGTTALSLTNENTHSSTRLAATSSVMVFIDSDNNSADTQAFRVFADNGSVNPPVKSLFNVYETGSGVIASDFTVGGPNLYLEKYDKTNTVLRFDGNRWLHLLPWGGSGYRWDGVCIGCGQRANFIVNGDSTVKGSLEVQGTCTNTAGSREGETRGAFETCSGGSVITGAVIEANLQTPQELAAGSIDRFGEGNLLCWNGEQLELCSSANDRGVQAVADANGRPIVLGAELVRVYGDVAVNDILVSSSKAGHAMVNNNPQPGTVIGQALEAHSGGSGLIKAMIRKW